MWPTRQRCLPACSTWKLSADSRAAAPEARSEARGPSEENVRGENRCVSTTYGIAALFHRCYFKKSNEKAVAYQWLGGNGSPFLFFCC
jgi:hypothetical protein